MSSKKSIRRILFLLAAAVTIWMNSKYQLIALPLDDMVNYQFNLFTISSGLAGFSFTTLGILLGMGSEVLIEKLKDTEIVTSKCRTIAQSLFFLCTACVAALYFIVGFHTVIDRICLKVFKNKFDTINESVYFILKILQVPALTLCNSANGGKALIFRRFRHLPFGRVFCISRRIPA